MITRSTLSSRRDLAPDVERLILTERSDRLIGAWARAGSRDPLLVDDACSWARDESALLALAGMADLSTRSLDLLTSHATPHVASRLLAREDLSVAQRLPLVPLFLASLEPQATGAGRTVTERVGDDPELWACAVEHCWPKHPALLGAVPRPALNDPRVHDAMLDVLESLSGSDLSDYSPLIAQRSIKSLAASPALSSFNARRLHEVALHLYPEAAAMTERRMLLDFPVMLSRLHCEPATGCSGDGEHLEDLSAVLASASLVDLPLEKVFLSALTHQDELGFEAVAPLATQLRGDRGRSVLVHLESTCGPGSRHLANAVQHLGTWPANALADPEPTFRALATSGWEAVTRSHHLPPAAREVVAMEFAPITELLSDAEYSAIVSKQIADLPQSQHCAALSLLGEWSGSLRELLECVKKLA